LTVSLVDVGNEKFVLVPVYLSTSLMSKANPSHDELRDDGIGDHDIDGLAVSKEVVRKAGRSLPSAASRLRSAVVWRIESNPQRAAPLRNRPRRILEH
jgi:hypothetical protein